MKKVLFVGCTNLSFLLLDYLINQKCCVISGVLTNREHFKISYSEELVQNFNYADLSLLAERNRIPFYRMEKNMFESNLATWTNDLDVDLILVVGWYHLIPKSWLERHLCVGLHASLLPKYRGGAPLVWAILNGETETGVTLFRMNSEVDAGPILLQESFPIHESDDISNLLNKTQISSINLIDILFSTWETIDFNRSSNALSNRIFPQRSPSDGQITQFVDAKKFIDFVRAQTRPYPGAYLSTKTLRMKVWKCRAISSKSVPHRVRKIEMCGKVPILQLENGAIELMEVEVFDESGKVIVIDQFIHEWNEQNCV